MHYKKIISLVIGCLILSSCAEEPVPPKPKKNPHKIKLQSTNIVIDHKGNYHYEDVNQAKYTIVTDSFGLKVKKEKTKSKLKTGEGNEPKEKKDKK